MYRERVCCSKVYRNKNANRRRWRWPAGDRRTNMVRVAFTHGTRSVFVLKEQLDVDFVASTCRRCVSFRSSFLMHSFKCIELKAIVRRLLVAHSTRHRGWVRWNEYICSRVQDSRRVTVNQTSSDSFREQLIVGWKSQPTFERSVPANSTTLRLFFPLQQFRARHIDNDRFRIIRR